MTLILVLSTAFTHANPSVICIDPGHPSEVGSGTRGKKLTEIHVAWEVATELKALLKADGYTVVLTKTSENEMVKNRRRAEIANEAGAAYMVRLHCDAGSSTGFTAYYPRKRGRSGGTTGPSEAVLASSKAFAVPFHAVLAKSLKGFLKDNGLRGDEDTEVGSKQGALTGSIFSKVPVVLIEMAVLTNPHDEELMEKPGSFKRLASAIRDATEAALNLKRK